MDAYRGHFDRVEIVLHPFLAPQTLPLSRFSADSYPSDAEILADCRPVAWHQLIAASAFGSLAEIDIALRSATGALRNPDRRLHDLLASETERLALIEPDAGLMVPHVEHAFLDWLAASGHKTLRIGDEKGEIVTELAIAGMAGRGLVPAHGMIAAMDGSALLVTHWDSCCSFLCRNDAGAAVPGLESFRCTNRTHVFWGLHPI